jgi:hypothetical protein
MVNELTYTLLPLAKLEVNKGQIEGVPKNPRFIRDNKYKQLVESISNTPEMMKARPLIVHQQGEKYVVLAGNMRLRAMRELKWHECPVAITAECTDAKKLREYAIKDNVAFGEDDMDLLANEWDLGELQDWGMDFSFNLPKDVHDRSEWAQGEADEEYNEFVEKFAPKLTTDDCYTPPAVYDVVLEWAKKRYNISEHTTIVRPFFPGGDFEHYNYPKDCVVIDNPPFSIMAKILDFYQERGIRFFLFNDTRKSANSAVTRDGVTFIAVNADIEYENGARVCTSFFTNMSEDLVVETAPDLLEQIEALLPERGTCRKIQHHHNMLCIGRIMRIVGEEFKVKRSDLIPKTECSKVVKDLFGSFGLLSDSKAAERKAAELKAAETYALEPSDYEHIAQLNEREANQ